MLIYFASPNTQQQAEHVSGRPVLLSYSIWSPWMEKYQQSFGRILIDSGAFSEHTGTAKVDLGAYAEWSSVWRPHADAIAGLDDIGGDWRRSLRNYEAVPYSFPTMHDSDPPELLADLIAMATERRTWLGVGLVPPRQGKEAFVRDVVAKVPAGLHVHGWALGAYAHVRRLDSFDSTTWWREAMLIRRDLPFLTYGEAMDVAIKKIERAGRVLGRLGPASAETRSLFEEIA